MSSVASTSARSSPSAILGALGIALAQTTANVPSAVLGGLVLAAILAGERWLPRVPMALPALLVALARDGHPRPAERRASASWDRSRPACRRSRIPLISIDQAFALLPAALGIAVLSFADTALTGRNFAEPHGERTDPNRELVALAAADLGGSLTSGYPVSSSASRTQAAEAAGAQTQTDRDRRGRGRRAGARLPDAAAGAPADPGPRRDRARRCPALHQGRRDRPDLADPDARGRRRHRRSRLRRRCTGRWSVSASPPCWPRSTSSGGLATHTSPSSADRRTTTSRISSAIADAQRIRGVLIVRFAGPLFFATATALGDRIRGLAANREPLTTVILDAYAVVDLDLTATDALRTIERELGKAGTTLVIARPTGTLRDLMRTLGLGHLVPTPRGATDPRQAVEDAASRRPRRRAARRRSPHPSPHRHRAPLPGHRPATSRPRRGAVRRSGSWPSRRSSSSGSLIAALTLGQRAAVPPVTGEVVAPNLIGIPVERARAITEDAGLVLGPAVYRQTSAYPEGTVISQTPGPGTPMAYGSSDHADRLHRPRTRRRAGRRRVAPVRRDLRASRRAGLRVGSTTRAPDPTIPDGVGHLERPGGRPVGRGRDVDRADRVVGSGRREPTPLPSPPAPPSATAPRRPPGRRHGPAVVGSSPSPRARRSASPPPRDRRIVIVRERSRPRTSSRPNRLAGDHGRDHDARSARIHGHRVRWEPVQW